MESSDSTAGQQTDHPAEEEKVATTATTLPWAKASPFQKVPKEIKLMIWEAVPHKPRVLELKYRDPDNADSFTLWGSPQQDCLTQICQTSRYIAERSGRFIFKSITSAGFWWNPDVDVFIVNETFLKHARRDATYPDRLQVRKNVKRVAIDSTSPRRGARVDMASICKDLLDFFPYIFEILVLRSGDEYNYKSPLYMESHIIRITRYPRDIRSLQRLRDVMQSHRQEAASRHAKMANLDPDTFFQRIPPPEIHAYRYTRAEAERLRQEEILEIQQANLQEMKIAFWEAFAARHQRGLNGTH